MIRLIAAAAASLLLVAQARAEIPGGLLKVGVLVRYDLREEAVHVAEVHE